MKIFGYEVKPASEYKWIIEQAVLRKEQGITIDETTFWLVVGIYESRLLGVCFFKSPTTPFIDKLTDRFTVASKKTNSICL